MTESAEQLEGCDCICDTCGDCELRPGNYNEQPTTWGDRFWMLVAALWFLALPVIGLVAAVRWIV